MVNNCANPQCAKPLHYLREGRIFVFDVQDPAEAIGSDGKKKTRMEHFWLCGECSQTMLLEQSSEREIRLVSRRVLRTGEPVVVTALAS